MRLAVDGGDVIAAGRRGQRKNWPGVPRILGQATEVRIVSVTVLARMRREISSRAAHDPPIRRFVVGFVRAVGYDLRHLIRVVHQGEGRRLVEETGLANLDVLEISAGAGWRKCRPNKPAYPLPVWAIARGPTDQSMPGW